MELTVSLEIEGVKIATSTAPDPVSLDAAFKKLAAAAAAPTFASLVDRSRALRGVVVSPGRAVPLVDVPETIVEPFDVLERLFLKNGVRYVMKSSKNPQFARYGYRIGPELLPKYCELAGLPLAKVEPGPNLHKPVKVELKRLDNGKYTPLRLIPEVVT